MHASSVLIKSAKGLQEIEQRTHRLAGRLRAMFMSARCQALQSRGEVERFIDETAQAYATTGGPKAAQQWRQTARGLAGLAN